MTYVSYAQNGRVRHWAVDAVIGAVAALAAITAAQAARYDRPEGPAKASMMSLRGPAKAPEAPPPALIAFQEPVAGYPVVSPFGLRKLPWENHGRLHEGVDISAPAGEPVRAAADGVITRAGYSASYGNFVEVRHAEGLTTLYAHLGAIDPAARSGAALKAGTAVGRIGSTGTSTGAHLHFEIRDAKDRPLNPNHFLGQAFAKAEDLPLTQAARVPRGVRLAYVSRIPESKRELMEAKLNPKKADEAKAVLVADASSTRPVGQFRFASRKEAIAKINAQDAAARAVDAESAAKPVVAVEPLSIPSIDGGA